MQCFIRYKDTAGDLKIFINYQHATDTTNGGCLFNVVSTNFTHSKFTFAKKLILQILSAKSSVTQPSYWLYQCPSVAGTTCSLQY